MKSQFMNGLFKAHYLTLAHPHTEKDGAVAKIGAKLHMGACIGSSDQYIRAAQDLAHGANVAAVIGVPENRAEIFLKREIEESVERILIAHRSQLSDRLAIVLFVLGLHHFLDPDDVPVSVKVGWRRIGQIGSQLLSGFAIGESLLAHLDREEHEIFPSRKFIENLAVLELEVAHERYGMR